MIQNFKIIIVAAMILVIISFSICPIITNGGEIYAEKLIGEILFYQQYLEPMKHINFEITKDTSFIDLTLLQNFVTNIINLSPKMVIDKIFTTEYEKLFVAYIQDCKNISFLRWMKLANGYNPSITYLVIFLTGSSILTGISIGLTNLYKTSVVNTFLKILILLSGIALVLFFFKIPYLNTFGITNNFNLRLLATIFDVQVSPTIWLFLFGTLLIQIFGTISLFNYSEGDDDFSIMYDTCDL